MFNLSPSTDQVKSMAGMLQAATLVTQLARSDSFDRTAMHAATYSLIKLDSESIDDLYGGRFGIDLGLRTMARLFSARPDNEAREIYQYAAGTHQLAMKLGKLQKTAGIIHSELESIRDRFAEFEETNSEEQDMALQSELADLYSRTVSFMSPRIIVQGLSLIHI